MIKMTMMKTNKVPLVLIVLSIILLSVNINKGFVNNDFNYLNILSNLALILAMAITIKNNNKIKQL